MILAKVVGNIVATRKDEKLRGAKLLVIQPVALDGSLGGSLLIAKDTVGAGAGETVIVVQGSSARMAHLSKDVPLDAAIIAIVDEIKVDSG
ncbi:EutN/CcmL family microcompartment protein [bacterium]|nr:EutN/CcmL family microcompartment protein [bacterium]